VGRRVGWWEGGLVSGWVGGCVLHPLANNLTGWKPSGRQPALINAGRMWEIK